jgi:Zn-dependent protease with chaperone function
MLCFGPGLPSGGQRVAARVLPLRLEIELEPGRVVSPAWFALHVASGGFDHQQLILSWSDGDAAWSAMPVDAVARELLVRVAPPELQARLAQWNKRTARTRRGFRLGWAVLSLIVASPLLLLLLFWMQSERIAGWVVDRIPIETERKLGELSFAQIEAGTKLIKEGLPVEVIREIGARLTEGSIYQYRWYVADDPAINAFAIPGGFVVVNSGLIDAAGDAEELAGVLAHEVQHVEQRHSLKGMVQGLGLQALIGLAFGDVAGETWSNLAAQLGTLKFGRDHESEADRLGLESLRRAGIDGSGMLRFFEKLATRDGASIALISTHPAGADRLAALQQAIDAADHPEAVALPYDWDKVRGALPARPVQDQKPSRD